MNLLHSTRHYGGASVIPSSSKRPAATLQGNSEGLPFPNSAFRPATPSTCLDIEVNLCNATFFSGTLVSATRLAEVLAHLARVVNLEPMVAPCRSITVP